MAVRERRCEGEGEQAKAEACHAAGFRQAGRAGYSLIMAHTEPTPTASQIGPALRAEMPIAREWAYFDHAAVAPISQPAADAMSRFLDEALTGGDTHWLDWDRDVQLGRQRAADLIGADPSAIALIANTTTGINFVAEGIDWRPGDNVVTLADEYPANAYAWIHQQDRGVETRRLPTDCGRVDLDALRDACDERTRVVTVSWVGFATGYRNDLDAIAEIAHSVDAFFFVDVIQGLGVFPLDVSQTPVDGLAACGHKWLLGAEGAGFAYLRPDKMERLRPINVGAGSVVGAHDYSTIDYRLRKTADRYEGGSLNMPGMLALAANLDLFSRWPRQEFADAVLAITDYACERLRSVGATVASHREREPSGHDPRSGILSFELPGHSPATIRKACLEAGVALSCRGGRVRVSPHAYTERADVDRLIEVLKQFPLPQGGARGG